MRASPAFAAQCLTAWLHGGGDEEEAQAGAELVADFLLTVRGFILAYVKANSK